MRKILCLSGWGQNYRCLEEIFNSPQFSAFEVISLDYSKFSSVADFFESVKSQNLQPEILVGWSLGGQLAARLIEAKILAPKFLVLLAPPFQMVKSAVIQSGMLSASFEEFYANFVNSPTQALKKFSILTAMSDRNASEIARGLDVSDENFAQLKFWLEELRRFSCFDVDFTNMPQTLLIQGAGDMIVHFSQADYFKQRIKNFRLEIFSNCGHAPHLSDVEMVRMLIAEEIQKLTTSNFPQISSSC